MDKGAAVLQGAFLLADQLCQPSSLSSIQKADWSKVGQVVVGAIKDACRMDKNNPTAVNWTERIICVVWLKLLCREAGEDIEETWRRNPFFPLQNGLPELNRVVLLELVKSTEAARAFAGFLLCFPTVQLNAELERFNQHVKSSPVKEEDVRLFLQVWWELWKGGCEQKGGASVEGMFASQLSRLFSESSSPNYQSAKRLKLENTESPEPGANADILQVLLHALTELKAHISSTDLCCQALSISLDALYTSFLIDAEVELPPERKLQMLSQMISSRGMNGEQLSPELIREAQRDLRASHTPAHFRPSTITLRGALKVVTELAEFWQSSKLLKMQDGCGPSFNTFRLQQSVQRVLTALDEREEDSEESSLRDLLKSLDLPSTESSPEVSAQVLAVVIANRLEDYESFAVLFADEMSQAPCDERWLDCLEKNQAAFRQHDALIRLSSTLRRNLHSQGADVSRCRKLTKLVADIFSALSLEDKNRALAATLQSSSRGFFQQTVPSALTEAFEKELNMAFNCIIQGGGRASAANLNTAVSLVARVSFQNPEAALKSCCQSAVFNKGGFSLMAAILQQLPGLRGQRSGGPAAEDGQGGGALLCRCLQETIRNKSLSNTEKEQFLKFLGLLMTPVRPAEGDEKQQSFLPPQEVINTFVLPHISAGADADLSLQLLQAALSLDELSSPHWVMLCSPFPLLYILSQLLHQTLGFWEQTPGGAVQPCSMDSKELLASVLTRLGELVGAEMAAAPSSYSRALFWLYNKTEELDWTVRFYLKPVWGEHFKNEVPSSLLAVCDLPEQEWSGSDLPPYGPGTGLLAWMECCCISDPLQTTMLSRLALDRSSPEQVGMFSKGVLVALTQVLPCCSPSQWSRLLRCLRELVASARLHVPFSLEYVDHLPLLDLRGFSCELRLSVLLLRALQLLCGSSCSHWLPAEGWAHVGRLYAHAVREIMGSVRAKQPLPSPGRSGVSKHTPVTAPKVCDGEENSPAEEGEVQVGAARSQEVLFVLSQLYCHVQHIQVMMPGGQCEALFLSSLDILSHYEAVMAAFPDSCTSVESDNTRHFFSTITDNLQSREMKAVLQQKIAQLVSSTA
ncbi:gem-associated protein 4 [Salarias fasciatus]|uniref:Gem (nuclear organelle) associated protein 4 n=1 Tax=Salarias fasciatus TaxID=181472 RepID=A0A672JEZ9_SALFA|nr:gem-associated protein 4 [Salarias fasciatus]